MVYYHQLVTGGHNKNHGFRWGKTQQLQLVFLVLCFLLLQPCGSRKNCWDHVCLPAFCRHVLSENSTFPTITCSLCYSERHWQCHLGGCASDTPQKIAILKVSFCESGRKVPVTSCGRRPQSSETWFETWLRLQTFVVQLWLYTVEIQIFILLVMVFQW